MYLSVARILFHPNLSWKTEQSSASFMKKVQDNHNHILVCCVFSCSCSRLHKTQRLENEFSKIFIPFMYRNDRPCLNQFKGVQMYDIPVVAELLTLNILNYDIDVADWNLIGKLATRNVRKYEKTVRLWRCNYLSCHVSNSNAVFQSFRCSICDNFLVKTFSLESPLTNFIKRLKNVHSWNVYQIRQKKLSRKAGLLRY